MRLAKRIAAAGMAAFMAASVLTGCGKKETSNEAAGTTVENSSGQEAANGENDPAEEGGDIAKPEK